MIQSQALLEDAGKERPDELIDYNPNRSHMIFGLRNMIMSVIGPDITMCGPLWAAMQVVVCQRYKHGREAMDSVNGGAGLFRFGTLTATSCPHCNPSEADSRHCPGFHHADSRIRFREGWGAESQDSQ